MLCLSQIRLNYVYCLVVFSSNYSSSSNKQNNYHILFVSHYLENSEKKQQTHLWLYKFAFVIVLHFLAQFFLYVSEWVSFLYTFPFYCAITIVLLLKFKYFTAIPIIFSLTSNQSFHLMIGLNGVLTLGLKFLRSHICKLKFEVMKWF